PKCPDMVVIPAGRFQMGDLSGDVYASEKPVHVVTIPKPIAVGKFEVTQAEWRAVMGSNPSGFKGDRNPVERINWNDAEDFVIKLRTKTGKNYRLLSEAEWEYAARAGTTTPFHTGNQITTDQANFNGNSSYNGSSKGLYREKTIAVGSFSANAFGLYDMHGNVEELVDDCWNDNYHGAPVKGEGWSDGDCSRRVVRGGSWAFEPRAARSANRRWSTFESYTTVHGIRIARDLSAEELRAGVTAPSQQVAVVAPQHPNVRQSVLPQGTITFEPFSFY
ncbi:MAG: formylglycine-generating enzyme family protein, partial [Rhodospirillaceae bacterium]|nr:formylglycine-generating enzyme family protein [Rhodospirillaceae bacterium]